MKKVFKYIAIILFALFLIDRSLDKFFVHQYRNSAVVENYALSSDAQEDIVIIGSSRASHHYDPEIIADATGLTCHNYGRDGQRIYYHYGILNLILSRYTPKVVIYDVHASDINLLPEEDDLQGLSNFYPLYDVNDTIKSLVNLMGWHKMVQLNISHLYRHNEKFVDYFINNSNGGGYSPLSGQWAQELRIMPEDTTKSQSVKKLNCIKNLIHLCKSNNIRLFIVISPKLALYENTKVTQKYSQLQELAKREGIPFLYYEQDTSFVNHREYFKDELHLNGEGAKRFSLLIGDYLNTHIVER